MTIEEEWRAAIVGLHVQFQKQILSMLIDKGILSGGEAQSMMFELAERMRHGSDLAGVQEPGVQEIVYFLAGHVENLGNELARRG